MSEQQPTPPRLKRREVWIKLPADYDGLTARIWLNAPQRHWNDLRSSDDAQAKAAAAQIVLEHNGWTDFDGLPYPQPSDPTFWDLIPTELMAVVFMAAQLEMGKLPNSMAPTRRR
jgi:hypothetical protein